MVGPVCLTSHPVCGKVMSHSQSLCDETKILTDTETETFYPRQIFPIPIPRLFFRDQIFRDRYRDFFSETKFSDTNTETFLTRPNLSIPIPRLFFRDQIFRYRDRDFISETKFSDTDTETTKKWAKVSRPGSLETKMSHSAPKAL